MARKPVNVTLDRVHARAGRARSSSNHVGNSGWARNSQTEVRMPGLLRDLHDEGVAFERVRDAMGSLGYDKDDRHELDRWESMWTTGTFGR